LRDLDRGRPSSAGAEQIAIANLNTGEGAFVRIEADPKTEFLAFGFLGRNIESQKMSVDRDGLDLQYVEQAGFHERPKALVDNVRAVRFALQSRESFRHKARMQPS